MLSRLQPLFNLAGIASAGFAVYYVVTVEEVVGRYLWLHVPSVVFVVFMILGMLLSSFSIANLVDVLRFLLAYNPARVEKQLKLFDQYLHSLCDVFYAQGAKGLKNQTRNMDVPVIWSKVFDYLDWSIPAPDILTLIDKDAHAMDEKLSQRLAIMQQMSAVGPSIGLLGTILGLMALLADLSDPTKLGGKMAIALVTTLYGVFFSVCVFGPLVSRLNAIRSFNRRIFNQAHFWVSMIAEGKPSVYLRQRTDSQNRKG